MTVAPACQVQPAPTHALDLIAQARSVLAENSRGLPTHAQRLPGGEPVVGDSPVVLSRGPVAPGDTVLFRLGLVNEDVVSGLCGVEVSRLVGDVGANLQGTVEPAPTTLAPGASADFTIRVPVPADASAGRYHGIATVSGAEAGPVVIVLTVGRAP
jgi:hypothetical protein